MLNYTVTIMFEGLACSVDHTREIDRVSNCEECGEGGDGDLGRDCVCVCVCVREGVGVSV